MSCFSRMHMHKFYPFSGEALDGAGPTGQQCKLF